MDNETSNTTRDECESPDDDVLTDLANRIRLAIIHQKKSNTIWRKVTLDLCVNLAKARARFNDNIGFDHWIDSKGFALNKDDRDAAIAIGQDPARAKEILDKTERRPIHSIHEMEFALPNPEPAKEERKKTPTPKTDKAYEALKEYARRGEKAPDRGTIAKKLGVSHGAIEKAKERLKVDNLRDQVAMNGAETLSKTSKEKLEAAIRAHKKKLDIEFEIRVRNEVVRRINEEVMPSFGEKLKKADAIIDRIQGIRGPNSRSNWPFSNSEFRMLLAALHPDSTVERRSEMFQSVNSRKDRLACPVDIERRAESLRAGFPSTLEELMKRRKQKEARP